MDTTTNPQPQPKKRKRRRPYEYNQTPVLVHRETLQYVLESLLYDKPAASLGSDSGAPSDGGSASEGVPAAGPSRRRRSRPSVRVRPPVESSGVEEDDSDSAFVDDLPASGGGGGECARAAAPARNRRPGAAATPLSRCRPDSAHRSMLHLIARAATHADCSGDLPQRLEAFQTACLLLPLAPHLIWRLALSLCITGGPEMPPLRTVLEQLLRHSGLDRPAARLAAFSALTSAGRHVEAEEILTPGRTEKRPDPRSPHRDDRLLGVVRDWSRVVQTPGRETRRAHLRALADRLEGLVEEESLRPALEPLIREVGREMTRP